MIHIGLVPLDDRPCNTILPSEIASIAKVKIHMPPKKYLGYFTTPGETQNIIKWLKDNVHKFDGLIVSIDMLAFGGLIASRLPLTSLIKAKRNLSILKYMRKKYPNLLIFASNIIMRITSTVTSDKQLEYWKLLFRYSSLLDDINIGDRHYSVDIRQLREKIPKILLIDYMKSRQCNHELNKYTLKLLKEEVIDYLLIGQEDASTKGLHIMEQKILKDIILRYKVSNRTKILCGADELNLLLMAKMVCGLYNTHPKISATFSTKNGPYLIPLYEDRIVIENLSEQIATIGDRFASTFEESDIIILINSPKTEHKDLLLEDNISFKGKYHPLIKVLKRYSSQKIIGLADIAFINGGDEKLFNKLLKMKLHHSLSAYGGWNTAANSLGSVISCSTFVFLARKNNLKTKSIQLKCLYKSFLDDIYYQSKVRKQINNELKKRKVSIWNLEDKHNETQALIKNVFPKYIPKSIKKKISKINTILPWPRTFEINLDFNLKGYK